MIAFATTTVKILRGNATTDVYGDPIDSDGVFQTGVIASIIEKTRYVQTADQNDPMIVRYIAGRLPGNIALQDGDRIQDERTNVIYALDSYSRPANPMIGMDVRCELKVVT